MHRHHFPIFVNRWQIIQAHTFDPLSRSSEPLSYLFRSVVTMVGRDQKARRLSLEVATIFTPLRANCMHSHIQKLRTPKPQAPFFFPETPPPPPGGQKSLRHSGRGKKFGPKRKGLEAKVM